MPRSLKEAKEYEEKEGKEKRGNKKKTDENEIRKQHTQGLHQKMDEQMQHRQQRIQYAVHMKNTTRQWDLIAAGVEQANIEHHGLEGKEATQMRGTSKIRFMNAAKKILQGIDADRANDGLATRTDWLRKIAGEHAAMGNKLINIARRMKVNAGQQIEQDKVANNQENNRKRAKLTRKRQKL